MASPDPVSSNIPEPVDFDILGGPNTAKEALRKMSKNRTKISTRELGVLAGRAVLDEYSHAKAETSAGALKNPSLLMTAWQNIPKTIFPLAGVVAALGVDYEVFGGAAKDMPRLITVFNAFAVGSLIFASGMAFSDQYKKAIMTTAIAATLGASFILANNNDFSKNFTDTLANVMTTGADAPKAKVNQLQAQKKEKQELYDRNLVQLNTGGNNGQGLLTDGNSANDGLAADIKERNIKLQQDIDDLTPQLAEAESELTVAERKDPVAFYGRLLAAGYIGAWLLASQFFIAGMFRKSADMIAEQRKKIVTKNEMEIFVNLIESRDLDKGKAFVEAKVANMITEFSEILSEIPLKADLFADLFEEDKFVEMTRIGTEHVYRTIHPKDTMSKKVKNYFSGEKQNPALSDENKSTANENVPPGPAME